MMSSPGKGLQHLSGLTLKNVSLKLTAGGKKRYEEQGELMFTHFGITGPLVLSASAFAGDCVLKGEPMELSVDLKPALTEDQLDQRLIRGTGVNGTEYTVLSTILSLPRAIAELLQSFDFTRRNPKLVCIHSGQSAPVPEDAILLSLEVTYVPP